MTMPKDFSKSNQSISPASEVMRRGKRKWFFWALFLIVSTVAAYLLLKPKSSAVTDAVPSGALVYVRLDHAVDLLKSLRSSKFWTGISSINVPVFLEHENFGPKKIEAYVELRNNVGGVISNPLFKQFLGREVAVALYSQFDDFSNGHWPVSFSGLLLIARPDPGTRVTEVLGHVWSQYSKEWDSSVRRYKNIGITSVKLKSSGVTVFYARINDLLAVSVDERVLHHAIDVVRARAGSIKQDLLFIATAAHFYNASSGEFLIDMPKTQVFLQQYWQTLFEHGSGGAQSLTQAKIKEAVTGLNGINAVGGNFLTGKPLRVKWVVLFDPAKSGRELNRLNGCSGINNQTLNMVPQDAIAYQWTNCLDFSAQYERLKENKQQISGQAVAVEPPFAELERTWGLSVEKDILPVLEKEVGWFVEGVEVGGFFPIPKFTVFLKVKDSKGADEILRKIVTTPLTLVQNENYHNIKINFVTVPLMNSFRPSYAFAGGYLIVATSDKLLKQSIDVSQDPSLSLAAEPLFKRGGIDKSVFYQMISFVKMGEIASQSISLVDWADHWFMLKIQQADTDQKATRQKLQVLSQSIEADGQKLISAKENLEQLRREKNSLEAQVQAAVVTIESKNTLSQEGDVKTPSVSDDLRPEKLLELKKSQLSAVELEINGLQKNIETTKAQQPELSDDLNDFEHQKLDALKYRYYIDEVVVPVLHGLESLVSQKTTMTVKDGVIESEMFLLVD